MIYLKLYENFDDSNIHEMCNKYGIRNYTINNDGTIDGNNIDLFRKQLAEIPLEFRNVNENFYISRNFLTSLKNAPIKVSGRFDCSHNKLSSLEFSPDLVGNNFSCSNNSLTSFNFMPEISGEFLCRFNKIRDFRGFIEPGGEFLCIGNPIYDIWKLFMDTSYIELLNEYDCIRGEDIIIDRLNQFLEEIDKPTVESVEGYNSI